MSDCDIGKTAKMLQTKLADQLAGPFREFLPPQWVEETFDKLGHHFRLVVFSPGIMLWVFVGQVLGPDHSCNRALARIQAHRAHLGLGPLSANTGG